MLSETDLSDQIRSLKTAVLSSQQRESLRYMLRSDVRSRCHAANQKDKAAWKQVKSREDWEDFCRPRIEALKRSLGNFTSSPGELNVHLERVIEGEGYTIQNLVYESRAGVYVTANIYLPSSRHGDMPAIVVVHSHHNPKTQGELQDMGITWARQGCAVLVMDQISYGERGQHAPGPRQDYRFRYINGIQLHVIGDSLMGWMVRDIMRGVDLLFQRDDVDRKKIILIGAVAGGGDVAAVAAAVDPRITCVIPFNFGGPQPETEYPLPPNAEEKFNYMGYGSWESTRNLRLSGRDGFLPWVIVASVAPRYLIYAHEFSWDREHDPVWKRIQKVYAFHNALDNLAFAHGAGLLSGRPPEATHCNNVGATHRGMIHPALERWFNIPVPEEYQNRLPDEGLKCLTPDAKASIRPLHKLFAEIGMSRAAVVRNSLAQLTPDEKRQALRCKWEKLLGRIQPDTEPFEKDYALQKTAGISIERILLKVDPDVLVPVLGLLPDSKEGHELPFVIGLAQEGKIGFLRERSAEIARLLKAGIALYLPDLRGTGETAPGASRERQSEATSISATEWMLGRTLLGSCLRDLRSILRYLRKRGENKVRRIALWGDSFAPANPASSPDPLIDEGEALHQSEPLGGLLALFGALYEDDLCAVAARGMIAGYEMVLHDRFCYIPHDAIIPGALTAGDLCDVAAALTPLPLRLEKLVNGRNCPVSSQEMHNIFEPIIRAYSSVSNRLSILSESKNDMAAWLEGWLR